MKMMPEMTLLQARVTGFIVSVILGGIFVRGYVFGIWTNYWILKDGRSTTAFITQEHSHGVVSYTYCVGLKRYAGRSQRNWQDPKYRNVHVGQSSIVYYSSSHPMLSSLDGIQSVLPAGLPVFLLASCFLLFAVATVINPQGRWAFNLVPKKVIGY